MTDQQAARRKGKDTLPLNKLLKQEGVSFTYEYDFGDSWGHELLLEAMLPTAETAVGIPRRHFPFIFKGQGNRLAPFIA